ncbi:MULTISPECIES: thiolase family protein [Pseudoalteromonas]|uniref:Acetyl-CoA acetyltransferase n=1 Tax=Pseudoalteromonas phenolica TaxID=161398 RepID=A0A0S2K293_9GAMM|nr:acetyl-CoA C-acyltransferase [Pseudoalteromonas phenolica]ALO42191.1 Acetyl-CoA acetyltransferase [Pseudoalteromonas phenolica]MBE0356715.1 acetyl-CoA C-acetyltransferase [Pseudoalteromonas phenolica O-BC30]RXE94773.1 acetyl-CoA C-acyltransferase [Pseudoalteromonas phenolica O-BC30]
MSNEAVVIVAAKRTPMGGFMGALSGASATELGATAIKSVMSETGLTDASIDEVIMGCVLPAGLGQAPARQAMLHAGLARSTGATTINKVCGSGLKAAMLAHDLIKAGSISSAVAGGMESMTNSPYFIPKARGGMRMGHGEIKDHMMADGLEDAYDNKAMGCFAQATADDYGITREEMDEFALSSLSKANEAIENGSFNNEVVPHVLKTRKGDVEVAIDEQPGNARPDKIPGLRPAFKKDGTITAANSSSISDGAAALILMSESEAKKQGLTPLCKVVAHATHSQAPAEFTVAPVGAMNTLLEKAGWDKADVDLWEINEAFAMVTMLAIKELGLEQSKVNVNGGACALGHPIGASGARILVTLIHALRNRGLSKGVASLCIGGGEAVALAVEV